MKNLDSKPGDVWDDKKGWISPYKPFDRRLPWSTDSSENDPWEDFDLFEKWLNKEVNEGIELYCDPVIDCLETHQKANLYSLFSRIFDGKYEVKP